MSQGKNREKKTAYIYYTDGVKGASQKNMFKTCEALADKTDLTLITSIGLEKAIDLYDMKSLPSTKKIDVKTSLKPLYIIERAVFVLLAYLHVHREDYDRIYTREPLFLLLSGLPLISKDYTFFYEAHDVYSDSNNVPEFLESRGLKKCDRVFCVSEGILDRLSEISQDEDKLILQPNCAETDKFSRAEEIDFDAEKVVTYVGSFKKSKDVPTLIKSFKSLEQDYNLFLIGEENENVLRCADGDQRIDCTGFLTQDEIRSYMKSSDLLVMTSSDSFYQRYYTCPMKLIEYMASGTPVIAADLPSTRRIAENSIEYYEPKNIDDLKGKMAEVLGNPEPYIAQAENAAKAVQAYTWKSKVEKITESFKEVEG